MNTFKNKLRASALGLTLVSACVVTLPAYAQDSNGGSTATITRRSQERRSRRTSV